MGLETVELIMGWEETFGITIDEAEACRMRTTADAIDYIYAQLKDDRPEDSGCLSMRSFYLLRKAFSSRSTCAAKFSLDQKISELLPTKNRRNELSAILKSIGFSPLSRWPFGLQITSGRVSDLILDSIIKDHRILRKSGHGWSRRQVREIARAVMFAQFSLKKFSDSAGIVKDLGLG